MAAPFVDTAKITVRSGNGGNGVVSFHREKYVANGGPDGGDGGRGGDIVVEVNDHMSTLMDFRYKRKYTAGNGADGAGKRCTGRDGEDLIIRVPRGTVIRDAETREIIQDMSQTDRFVLCRGGRGGWGRGPPPPGIFFGFGPRLPGGAGAGGAGGAGATSTSPPPPARCPGSPRPACPARAGMWCWS